MRKTKHMLGLAVAASIGLISASAAPAGAAVVGGGQATGTVTLANPGMPVATAPQGATTYTFTGVVITGIFSDGLNAFDGTINVVNVKGGSPAENTISGSGNVNTSGDQASLTGVSAGKTICGRFYGTFSRVGSIVLVDLNATLTIASGTTVSPCAGTSAAQITVAAEFSPTAGNGVTTNITVANFTGVYATV